MAFVNMLRGVSSAVRRAPDVFYRGKQIMWGLWFFTSDVSDKIYENNLAGNPKLTLDFSSIRSREAVRASNGVVIPNAIKDAMYSANVDSLRIEVNDAPILHYDYTERPRHSFMTALKIAIRELASNGIPSKPIKMDFSYLFDADMHGSGPCGRVIAKAELRSDGNKHAVLEFYYEIQYA